MASPKSPAPSIAIGPLNTGEVANLQAALRKLAELNDSKIVTKNSDAEKAGLTEFLRNSLSAHASELLGCWVVCNSEYVPLLRGIRGVLGRIEHIKAEEQADASVAEHRKAE